MSKFSLLTHFKSKKLNYFFLFSIVLIYLYGAVSYFDRPLAPDAKNVYLPYSAIVLEQGLSFLTQIESVAVAPMSYLWPAILGGELEIIKSVNVALGVLIIFLVYQIGIHQHSNTAGLLAAFLFAKSPFLISWIPTALSEPPYFFFTVVWMHALSNIAIGKKHFIPIAAIALSLSILTRSVWLYPTIFILIVLFALRASKIIQNEEISNLSLALSYGLIIPILFIFKNFVLFGLISIDLGAGGAMYYGTHIITNGFEPPLLGMIYEGGSGGLAGNREHIAVAMQFIKERSLFELLDWYSTKISWVTLFSPIEASIKQSVWRVFELSMAITTLIWGIRVKNTFVLLLFLGVLLQIFQTSIVLYNIRYSIDGLELFLLPLAAIGICLSLNIGFNSAGFAVQGLHKTIVERFSFGIFGFFLFVLLLVLLGFRPIPKITLPSNIPTTVLFSNTYFDSNSNKQITSNNSLIIDAPIPAIKLMDKVNKSMWSMNLSFYTKSVMDCKKASLNYVKDGLPDLKKKPTYFNIYDDGLAHTYLIGTSQINSSLFPDEAGKLVLEVDCNAEKTIKVNSISLIVPHFKEYYFK